MSAFEKLAAFAAVRPIDYPYLQSVVLHRTGDLNASIVWNLELVFSQTIGAGAQFSVQFRDARSINFGRLDTQVGVLLQVDEDFNGHEGINFRARDAEEGIFSFGFRDFTWSVSPDS